MKANEKVQVKVLKRRIEQLLNGIFEYETPKLQISEDKIEVKSAGRQAGEGKFQPGKSGPEEGEGLSLCGEPQSCL